MTKPIDQTRFRKTYSFRRQEGQVYFPNVGSALGRSLTRDQTRFRKTYSFSRQQPVNTALPVFPPSDLDTESSADILTEGGDMLTAEADVMSAFPLLESVANLIGTALGDIAGGYTVTVTGENFVVGSTSVTFGGVAATGVSVSSGTTLTCTVPAGSSGVVVVAVTTSVGRSNTMTFEYFSPAQLVLTGWWRADFTGAPWLPTASAGTSGANGNFVHAVSFGSTQDPTQGTAVNGHIPSDYVESPHEMLMSAQPPSTFISSAGGQLICLVNNRSTHAPNATALNDDGIFGDELTVAGIGGNSSGFRFINNVGHDFGTVSASTNAWHVPALGWDGVNFYWRVDGGTQQSAASTVSQGNINSSTNMVLGANANNQPGNFQCLEAMIAGSALTLATQDKIRGYFSTRYNVAC